MKEKFTPGPWTVNEIGQHWNNKSLTHLEVTFGAHGECVCDTVYQRGDANLIAAAPELLSALQGMLEINSLNDAGKLRKFKAAKAAIAKALGESQ